MTRFFPARAWSLLKSTYFAWDRHEAPRMGAALAFYTLLSLSPLILFVITLLSFLLDRTTVQAQLGAQIHSLAGAQAENALTSLLHNSGRHSTGLLASAVGLATLLFGASGVFGELRSALNKIWDAHPVNTGFVGFVRERFFSFGMVLSVGFLLMVSLVLSSALATASKYFEALIHAPLALLAVLNFLISLAGIAALFALIFKFVPETEVHWRDVRTGALFTAVLFTVGKTLIGLYIGRAGVGSPFGAAGSLVAMTVWVYYSAQVFLFGAEFTRAYSTASPTPLVMRRPSVASSARVS